MVDKCILVILDGHVIYKRHPIYILQTRVLQLTEYLLVVFTACFIFDWGSEDAQDKTKGVVLAPGPHQHRRGTEVFHNDSSRLLTGTGEAQDVDPGCWV